MKKFGAWLVLIGIVGATVWLTLDHNAGVGLFNILPKENVIPENEWKIVQQTDSTGMIRVEWDQKYGETKAIYCRVVFQNESQYKLVAPWINMAIEKPNTNNIKYIKEPFDSVKIKKSIDMF